MLRSGVGIISQFALEATPGAGGAANRYVESFNWSFNRTLDPKNFRGSGSRVNTVKVHHKKMARGTLTGVLDYNSFPYFCEGLFNSQAAGSQIGSLEAYQRVYTAGVRSSDGGRKTFAVEVGDANACEDYTFVQLLGFSLEANQDDFSVSADTIAKYPEDNQVIAGSPTIIAPRPVERDDVNIYLDDDFANLGTTQVSEAIAESLTIPNKFLEAFFHNRSNPSFADVLEIPYEPKFGFETAHNTQSRALIASLKNNPAKWIRWEAQGELLGKNGGQDVYELIQIDMMVRFDDPEALLADDAPYAYRYDTELMPDNAGLMTHLKITTINSIAIL